MSTISRTYLIEFPLELVFSKWVAEDTVVSPTESLEIEPRIGGTYKLFMNEGSVMEGVFTQFKENEHVTYSWNWVGSDETTEVDVTFQSHPDGSEVQLTHSGFESSTSLENHAAGWDSYIEGFSAHIKNSG